MNNELFKHEKSDTIKWIIAFTLIAVLIFGVIAAIFIGVDNKKDIPPQEEQTVVTDGNGNAMESGTVYAMPANMVFATTAAEQSNAAEGITLQATITPDTADNKAVDWNVSFVNPSSSWASGKNVSDYVTVTPASDGALTATVNCLKAFGEQIKITVVSRANEYAKAECILDYARRILDTALYMPSIDGKYLLEFGSNEIVVDMVAPDCNTFISGMRDGSIWTDGYYMTFLDDFSVDENSDDTIFDKSLEKTYKFSDYTIKDCMICSLDEDNEYLAEVTTDFKIADGYYEIMERMYYDCTVSAGQMPMQPLTEAVFSNNPVAMALIVLTENKNQVSDFDETIYNKYLAEFIGWIKENPDTPIIECTTTITGKYSTFTREYSFRFNPETAVMPVFGVALDKETVVI